MKRHVSQVNLGLTQKRIRVRIEADPSPEKGIEANLHKMHLLQSIVLDPGLMACDLEPFDTLRMYYAGDRWALEAEAVIDQSPGG